MRFYFARFTRRFAAACCLGIMAGCAVGPDYHHSPAPIPSEWKAGVWWKAATPRDAEIKDHWWELYDDPVLSGIEMQAVTNSPQVAAAYARVEQARAVARITHADFLPSATLAPSAIRSRFTANRPAQTTATTYNYTATDFVVPLDLSYELDIWGRVRRSFSAARADAASSEATYQNVMLTLEAELAQTYFTIRSVDLERRVVGESVELRKKSVDLIQSLHTGGAGSAIDVARAETELASAQSELIGLKLRRDQLENAVAVLCGQSPSTFHIAESTRRYRPPSIPVDLEAGLLERRPDVAAAERGMAAASERIGIAKAAFFPSIRLTGTAGVESADLKSLFNWESRTWSFGPSVSLPIFEGGRNVAELGRARAAFDEAVQTYRQQTLVAFQDVENALNGLNLLKDEFDYALKAVNGAQKVAELSRTRYKEGLASYFEVVDAERTFLENEILAYQLNGERMVTSVQLIKALGGGWKPGAEFPSPAPNAQK
jgi:multidrug efflux system outer membrane protein